MKIALLALSALSLFAACRGSRAEPGRSLAFTYTTGPDEMKPGFLAVYGTLYNRGSGDVELLSETCDGLPLGLTFDKTAYRRHARIQCFANWPVVVQLKAGDSLAFIARLEPLQNSSEPAFSYRAQVVTGPYNPDSVRLRRLPPLVQVQLP